MTGNDQVTVTRTFVPAQLPVFIGDLSNMRDQLREAREAIDELRASHPESTPSNVKAVYMSPWKSHTLNPKLLPLCTSVTRIAGLGARGITGTELTQLNVDLVVTDCWGAVYETADSTSRHNHFPADFAAVVYLEADEGCAPIVFAGETRVQPRPGMLLLFPGILDHEVPENDGRRVMVAMNLYKKATFTAG
jgi:hypothetical protein